MLTNRSEKGPAPGTFDRLFDRFHAEAAQVTAATDAQSAALREASRLADQARAAHRPRPKVSWWRRLYRRFVKFDVLGSVNSIWD